MNSVYAVLKTFTYEVCTHTRKIAKQHCVLIGVTGWFLLKANWENFQINHGQNKLHIDEVMMITPTCLVWFLSCLLNLTTVCSACSSIRTHYPDSEQTILALSSLMSLELCLAEKQQILIAYPFLFDPTGLEPKIYRTRKEHVNDYTTDANCSHCIIL